MVNLLSKRTLPALAVLAAACLVGAQSSPLTKGMGVEQKLGESVPKDAIFRDETGKTVRFGDLLGPRPVVVIPMFYRCQTGCLLITHNLLKTLTKAAKRPRAGTDHELKVGKEMDIVLLGLHPKETPDLARAKKETILADFQQPDTADNWHLLTGDEKNIRRVTDALGFRYTYDPQKNLLNHPAAAIFLTPQGRISSYIVGTDFPTMIVQEDLKIAAREEIGREAETFLFGCIMLDPVTGQRTIVYKNVLRLACVLTLIVLVGSIVRMSLKHRGGPTAPG